MLLSVHYPDFTGNNERSASFRFLKFYLFTAHNGFTNNFNYAVNGWHLSIGTPYAMHN